MVRQIFQRFITLVDSLFINYYKDSTRASPFNTSFARVFFGFYALWKVATQVRWQIIPEWPVFVVDYHSYLIPYPDSLELITVEKWVVVVLLLSFIIGYRVAISGFVAAVLTAHMSGILFMVNNSGTSETFVPIVYLLLFFAVFREQDKLSIDEFRRSRNLSITEINRKLQEMDTDRSFDHDILKWALLMVSLTILFTGVAKLGYLPEWASAETQAFFAIRARAREGLILPLSDLLINYRWIALFAGVTTIILEFGLFAAVLTGFSVSPFIIGLIGMHTGIALILTPFFFDQYFIYLLFAPWDSLHKRFTSNNEIDVVYDSRCHFCARSLLLIKNLDDHSAISFHSQNSIPEKYDNDQFDFDEAMYAFSNGEAKKGYFAFRLLFRQFWLLKPLAALMKLRPVKWVGIKLYGWVASNRSRFQCAPDSSV